MIALATDDELVGRAVGSSVLCGVSSRARAALFERAPRRMIEPGRLVHSDGDRRPHVHLVLSGLVRMSVGAADGRRMTVRYCRSGSLIGVASVFAPDFRLPVTIEAVTGSALLDVSPSTLRELVGSDASVARAMLAETGSRVQAYVEEIARASFATVPERLARHLLDLSTMHDDQLIVRATQEELAAAVGTVREVAARALRNLRDRGFVRTERNRVLVTDPDGLADIAIGVERTGESAAVGLRSRTRPTRRTTMHP